MDQRKSKIIRLFISSTFSDMLQERELIQQKINPEIKIHCRRKGWQFEMVDLRWGVSSEASSQHKTMQICMNELRHCQQISPKPNFLLLIGQRYGWIPLPEKIREEDFYAVTAIATQAEVRILDEWYERNDNSTPCVYELMPDSSGDKPHFSCDFSIAEKSIKSLLSRYVTQTGDAAFQERYLSSATHQEIIEGVFKQADLWSQTIYYDRVLQDCPEDTCFIDKDNSEQLAALKRDLSQIIPPQNTVSCIRPYSDYASADFDTYFITQIKSLLLKLVDEEIQACNALIDDYEEDLGQQSFVETTDPELYGREVEVAAVERYLAQPRPNGILLLNSPPGYGKSYLLARVLHRHIAENSIFKFIGNSWMSSEGVLILQSMLRQLNISYKSSEAYLSLARKCSWGLRETAGSRPILIDALDQLRPDDPFLDLSWLPNPLPENLHVILSKTSDCTIQHLSSFATQQLKLGVLTWDQASIAFSNFLRCRHRRVSPAQLDVVEHGYQQVGCHPLYLSVVGQMALEWRSSDQISLQTTMVEQCLHNYIDRLIISGKHDKQFVLLVLGLLCFSNHGVTEDEILEITASDSAYYNSLVAKSFYKITTVTEENPRTPYAIWSSFSLDFARFLAQRKMGNQITFTITSRQLKEYIRSYLKRVPALPERIFRLMSDYFEADTAFANLRTLEELPYVFLCQKNTSKIGPLLCNPDFIQAKCACGMIEDLQNNYTDALTLNLDTDDRERINRCLTFLVEQKSALIKYAKFEGEVKKRWIKDQEQLHKKEFGYKLFVSLFRKLMLSNTGASCVCGKHALICAYTIGDSRMSYAPIYLWDLEQNRIISHIDIPLCIYRSETGYSSSNISCSLLTNDARYGYFYDDSGLLWTWNTQTNQLSEIKQRGILALCNGCCNKTYYITENSFGEIGGSTIYDQTDPYSSNRFQRLYADPHTQSMYVFSQSGYYLRYAETDKRIEKRSFCSVGNDWLILGFSPDDSAVWFRSEEKPSPIYCQPLDSSLRKQFPVSNLVFEVCISKKHRCFLYVEDDCLVGLSFDSGEVLFSIKQANTRAVLALSQNGEEQFYTVTDYSLTVWAWH